MNSEEYREQIRRQIEQEAGDQESKGFWAGSDDPEQLLRTVRDTTRPAEERIAALEMLQQLSFSAAAFAELRPAFIETLRAIVDDPDERLRAMVLESLAQEKDEYAQRRLLAGLAGEENRLVTDERAIQFLGYDIHGEHFPLMRRLALDAPDPGTRREAVKVLSSDTESADLLLDIYGNKSEVDEVRRASASALLSVDPVRFEERAKETVVDDDDAESVRAASLTALTYYGNPSVLANDKEFVERVARVKTGIPDLFAEGTSPEEDSEKGALAKAVRVFQAQYGVR
jgi:HEAT repeat protein